ncbi:hypothetical protein LSCM1_05053 [Leishmania martiniquensis]|uniref:Helicase-like protein n=1 Tax=Leishmania martiniquensis TaxID=1580590 RepID=A0A836KP77_9TRYP|nr:hypothetical protein LSCM1_05053 [Leishmania martiniquensis]
MEAVLYGLAPPQARPNPPSASRPAPRFDAASALQRTATGAPVENAGAEQKGEGAVFHAGGSPCAMPAKQSAPPPHTLAELRSMTSSEVREVLERFFVLKDAHVKRFKSVEVALLGGAPATHEDDAAAVGSAVGVGVAVRERDSVATSRPSKEEAIARDRCRRLVNVSNWDAAVDGYDQWDVLLPSALLRDCVVAPTSAVAGQASTTTAASSGQGASPTAAPPRTRSTLRPHQVEGIRFLWSVLVEGPVGQVPAVGCILAHTMGLGKTAQVIVFLHLFMASFARDGERMAPPLRRRSGVKGALHAGTTDATTASSSASSSGCRTRVLIVVPKSTQSGWKKEFCAWSEFFPEEHRLRPISLSEGLPVRQRVSAFHAWRRDGGILLIGYEALVRLLRLVEGDSVLQPHPRADGDAGGNGAAQWPRHPSDWQGRPTTSWAKQRRNDDGGMVFGGVADPFTELVVCDEAHRLKSAHLSVVTALRGLHPLRRLLLTGTPLQNHLREYWAMMDLCVHKYFSRKRFQEYFIQPIEASASTRASEQEVDLARKKTFTLINEVRHFVQRVDSTPLRTELPPLHEYIVVVPLSPLQKELYLRFIHILQNDGTQAVEFLPAVSYSGKIAAHPQLLFQMRDRVRAGENRTTASAAGGKGTAGRDGRAAQLAVRGRRNYRGAIVTAEALRSPPQKRQHQEKKPMKDSAENVAGDDNGDTRGGGEEEPVVIIDSDTNSTSVPSSDDSEDEEHAFSRAMKQSFSSVRPAASLTYEELCVPPSPNYIPLLEDGVKLLVAIKLVAAAVARGEKALLFSLSTQLLTLLEGMIANVNEEWRRPGATSQQHHPQLSRPIRYCRLDGTHTAAQRAALLDEFDRPDGPDLFLLSTKAGGVGTTITAATRVILVDTSFNPADDQQAIGRAYRYGQTRPVYVYRLICYPTLEYSIFLQKLAKEWLFKTVIEESSVKRDGLSGMHLRELFSLLTKAAKVLERPLSATRAQARSTQEVLNEDPMLAVAQAELLYAQRYQVFLEHDMDDQYGAAEEAFYHDYCRSRLFDLADDDTERRHAVELQQRRQQRIDEAAQLQVQSKTLISMVDDLIRSRAGADAQLTRLLTAMGLHVDPVTGRVQSRRSGSHPGGPSSNSDDRSHVAAPPQLGDRGERLAPSPVQLVGGADTHLVSRGSNRGGGGNAEHSTPQTAALLLLEDSDEDTRDALSPPRARQAPTSAALSAKARGDRISATLAREPYAPYRPGSSPAHAVDVDSDESP